MNVSIVNKYHFVSGGPERYLFSVTDLLERGGHRVIPLSLRLARNRPSPYEADFLPPPAGEGETRFQDFRLGLRDRLRLLGRAIYFPEARRRMARIVRREKIEAAYLLNICNYISPSVIDGAREAGARVALRLSDFNFVCASYHFFRDGRVCDECLRGALRGVWRRCAHGSAARSLARFISMKAHEFLGVYRKVDAFVAPSRFMAETLVRWGAPRGRVHHLPGFVNLEGCAPRYRPGDYALYFGRLSPEKGVDVALRAWAEMGRAAPPLRIVGEGPDRAMLTRMAERLGLRSVEFPGFLAGEALREAVSGSAFVLAPSLWPENSANTVYEAMAFGKAVIASRIGGLTEQTADGVTGLLVRPGDPTELAEAADKLWRDRRMAESFGRAGRRRMETVFSAERHLKRLEGILGGAAQPVGCGVPHQRRT